MGTKFNNSHFVTKALPKSMMFRLHHYFLDIKIESTGKILKQSKILAHSKNKKKLASNINTKILNNKKKFWTKIHPHFPDKGLASNKIII